MQKHEVNILDCTLRDGSYVIDYQFTTEDTYVIAKALAAARIKYIEVGHGLGLDAQQKGKGAAAQNDMDYVKAAVSACEGRSKVGVFYIPNIGEMDSIRRLKDSGGSFIRIGTDIQNSHFAEKPLQLAKKLGLETSSNLMKSYTVSAEDFARHALRVESYGADTLCLVDSAGGMTPREIMSYGQAIRSKTKAKLGFHGHDNLRLVTANCLAAAEAGFNSVDCSLRGMGRSAGNAATEIVAALLAREGFDIAGVEWKRLIEIAEKLIAPMLPRDAGLRALELASGLSYFHSGFQSLLNAASKKHQVNPHEAILNLTEESRTTVTESLADDAAHKAAKDKGGKSSTLLFDASQLKSWKSNAPLNLDGLWSIVKETSAKTGYPAVISIGRSRQSEADPLRFTPVRAGWGYVVAHIESKDPSSDETVLDYFDRETARIMIDRFIDETWKKQKSPQWIVYDDDVMIMNATVDFMRLQTDRKTFKVMGSGEPIENLLTATLHQYGYADSAQPQVMIAFNAKHQVTENAIESIQKNGVLLLAQTSSTTKKAVDLARNQGLQVQRLDLSECLMAEVARLFGSWDRLKEDAGQVNLEDCDVVAGGFVGSPGSVVVNSVKSPSKIYGVTDGYGRLEDIKAKDSSKHQRVLQWMLERMDLK